MDTMRKRFLASELDDMAPESARFHVIPVPYEESVSYGGGTATGPDAILDASEQLELWDGFSIPAELGIYTQPPVDCSGGAVAVLDRITLATRAALQAGGVPVLLGGEHTVTYGALAALKEKHGTFGVVQFDAHADLRDSYSGTRWSHACVMRRAVSDLGLPLVQFGVRALGLDELDFRKTAPVTCWDAAIMARDGLPQHPIPVDFPDKIYISFDVDGLDPSIMPATGTPVPGGLGWYEARHLVERSVRGRSVLGFDVVELAPIAGFHAADFTAARLVYDMMGIMQREARW